MSLSPEDDLSAAEYALGTLDAAERAAVAARRLREAELDQAIVGWELRLAPLAEAIPPAEPPRNFLGDIEARLGGTPLTPDAVVDLTKRLRFWRAAAVAAGAIAAALAIGVALQEMTRLSAPHQFVAVLQKS